MSSENNTKISIAIIGLIGVLGGALFANWDKMFPPQLSTEENNNGITPISKELAQEVGNNTVEKYTWVCSETLIGEYVEINPDVDSKPAKLIFDSNGKGLFQYEDESATIKEEFRWNKQKENEFLIAYTSDKDEISSTEFYTCADDVLSVKIAIDDGYKTNNYRKIR